MTTGIKKDHSLESKFEAHRLHNAGLRVATIAAIMEKDRATIYHRIDTVDSWLRSYSDIKEQYEQYVKNHGRSTAISG